MDIMYIMFYKLEIFKAFFTESAKVSLPNLFKTDVHLPDKAQNPD